MDIHKCERLLTKSQSLNLALIGVTSSFSGMALNAFWKRALHVFLVLSLRGPLSQRY